MKKFSAAGMFLWEVEIEYDNYTSIGRRTLTVAIRRNTLIEARKKAVSHLKALRFDYPKAKIIGIHQRGFIDA